MKFVNLAILSILLFLFGSNQCSMVTLDATFGNKFTGYSTDTFYNSIKINAIAIQPADNKIVIAGSANVNGQTQLMVGRYTANGTIDSTFGTAGTTVVAIGSMAYANSVTLDTGGNIIVAGSVVVGSTNQVVLARFTASGVLDTSFNPTGSIPGVVTTQISNYDSASSVATSGTNIVICGITIPGNAAQILVARYTSTGSLDNSFGTAGITQTPITSFDVAYANSIAIQSDGNIVVGGTAISAGTKNFMLARYLNSGINAGTLDSSFNSAGAVPGIVTTLIGTSSDCRSIAFQSSSGNIVAAGVATVNGYQELALARYTSAGILDTSFNNPTGYTTTQFGLSLDVYSVAIQADGNYIVAGTAFLDGSRITNIFVARYLGSGASSGNLDTTNFGNGGIVYTALPNSVTVYSAAIQTVGSSFGIVIAGSTDINLLLARYLKDNSNWITIDTPANGSSIANSNTSISGISSTANAEVAVYVNNTTGSGIIFTSVPTDSMGNWSVQTSPLLLTGAGANTITAQLFIPPSGSAAATATSTFTSTAADQVIINIPANSSNVTNQLNLINGYATQTGQTITLDVQQNSTSVSGYPITVTTASDGSWNNGNNPAILNQVSAASVIATWTSQSLTATNNITNVGVFNTPAILNGFVDVQQPVGTTTSGKGFSVHQDTDTQITITYTTPFALPPTVTAVGQSSVGNSTVTIAGNTPVTAQAVTLAFTAGTTYIHFIAMNFQ